MKKYFYLSSLAVAAVMASCSSDDVVTNQNVEASNPVAIELTASASATVEARSSVESLGTVNAFNATDMGFFMLAKNAVATWDPAGALAADYIWWENISGNAEAEGTAPDYTGTKLTFPTLTDYHKFYPVMGMDLAYNFYAYYPRVATLTTANADQRVVSYTIDGTQDIIAGAGICTEATGYNAKYFRQPANLGKKAAMTLGHKLMRFQFMLKAGDDNGSFVAAERLKVVSVVLKQVPSKGSLIVADRVNAANNGKLTFDWANDLVDFPIKKSDAEAFVPMQVQAAMATTPAKVGQGIMVPVPEDAAYKYQVVVTLEDEGGQQYVSNALELSSTTPWAAGKSYKVNMTVYGQKEIELSVSLTPWDESTDDINLEFN